MIEIRESKPHLHSNGVALESVLDQLVSIGNLAAVAEALDISPADLVITLGFQALGDADSEGPPLVTGAAKHAALKPFLIESAWAKILPNVPRPHRLALSAGLLQVFDHWESSHEAAQQADDLGERPFSAYWHAIAHRREPDAGNASYWFRRVGRHPVQRELAEEAAALIEGSSQPVSARKLIAGNDWNSSAMIEFCGDGRPRPEVAKLARRIQRLEMKLLLEATAQAYCQAD
ncbi:hypothetical protein [Singulisphaera sp. PoT]|uniref:hypothetical protein n=1 Tax=Singulisphaera sp. PoT TaxID=3411797 RepID=UPI003BF5D287